MNLSSMWLHNHRDGTFWSCNLRRWRDESVGAWAIPIVGNMTTVSLRSHTQLSWSAILRVPCRRRNLQSQQLLLETEMHCSSPSPPPLTPTPTLTWPVKLLNNHNRWSKYSDSALTVLRKILQYLCLDCNAALTSQIHAYIESVRTNYGSDPTGEIKSSPAGFQHNWKLRSFRYVEGCHQRWIVAYRHNLSR